MYTLWLSDSTLKHLAKEMQIPVYQKKCTIMFTAAQFTIVNYKTTDNQFNLNVYNRKHI